MLDLRNKLLGSYKPLRIIGTEKRYKLWECQCVNCGIIVNITAKNLDPSRVRRCPCLHKTKHPLYTVWLGMRDRCNNPHNISYKWYGAKGVMVCKDWSDCESFISWGVSAGWRDGLVLDRIDNMGDYTPLNCRWVTPSINNLNRTITLTGEIKYTGINRSSRSPERYLASLSYKNKKYYIGSFSTVHEAVEKRNKFIIDNEFPHKLNEFDETQKC